jgi:hypothetical protein
MFSRPHNCTATTAKGTRLGKWCRQQLQRWTVSQEAPGTCCPSQTRSTGEELMMNHPETLTFQQKAHQHTAATAATSTHAHCRTNGANSSFIDETLLQRLQAPRTCCPYRTGSTGRQHAHCSTGTSAGNKSCSMHAKNTQSA